MTKTLSHACCVTSVKHQAYVLLCLLRHDYPNPSISMMLGLRKWFRGVSVITISSIACTNDYAAYNVHEMHFEWFALDRVRKAIASTFLC